MCDRATQQKMTECQQTSRDLSLRPQGTGFYQQLHGVGKGPRDPEGKTAQPARPLPPTPGSPDNMRSFKWTVLWWSVMQRRRGIHQLTEWVGGTFTKRRSLGPQLGSLLSKLTETASQDLCLTRITGAQNLSSEVNMLKRRAVMIFYLFRRLFRSGKVTGESVP